MELTKKHLSEAKRWMRVHIEECVDSCGEIDCTKLAEDCANHFEFYDKDSSDAEIPEEIFDLAVQVSEETDEEDEDAESEDDN